MLRRASSLAKPRPPVELAWGSQSMRSVGRPSRARAAARLMAVVVLPTPPFWLTTAMTLEGDRVGGAVSGLVAGFWTAGMVAMRVGCAEVRRSVEKVVECWDCGSKWAGCGFGDV